jgi:hypothetical protein
MKKNLALLIVILCLFITACNEQVYGDKAKENAIEFAQKLTNNSKTFTYNVIDCSGKDSDGDGYVTCTINKVNTVTDEEKVESYDCAYSVLFGDTNACKPKNVVTIVGNN